MDNTPRGRIGEHAKEARPNNPDMLWIDAICQQALSARMISKMFVLVGDKEQAEEWARKYEEKKDIVNKLYWDEKDGFYYDIDCNTNEFYKVMSIASFWTLTSEIAPKERAELMAKQLDNPKTFGGIVPFVSVSRSDNDFNRKGQYWRGGVWLPTAYAALKGLANYGYYKEAHETATKLLDHMYATYKEYDPHTIWECYSPEEHKPATNPYEDGRLVGRDFCGWSALGPISAYIEFVLGFHSADAFTKTVKWEKPDTFKGKIGIKNLHFGDVVTDITADGDNCVIVSNADYRIEINGKAYEIHSGENEIEL